VRIKQVANKEKKKGFKKVKENTAHEVIGSKKKKVTALLHIKILSLQ